MSELSPFRYRQDMTVSVGNKRVRCSGTHINELISKGIISEPDIAIMKVYKEYGYLNRYNATRLVNEVYSGSGWIKEDYGSNFKKLTEHAILIKYDITGDESWPPCYSLSHGADVYMEQSFGSRLLKSLSRPASAVITGHPEELMRILSANQFHASMFSFYKSAIKKYYRQYVVRFDETSAVLDYIYRIENKQAHKGYYDVAVISQRHYDGWDKDYRMRLMGCVKCGILECPVVIVLCENDVYTLEAERVRLANNGINRLAVYYTIDINSAFSSESPLNGVYRYRGMGTDMAYDVVNLNI